MSETKILVYADGRFSLSDKPEWLMYAESNENVGPAGLIEVLERQGLRQFHTTFSNQSGYVVDVYLVPEGTGKNQVGEQFFVEISDSNATLWRCLVPETEWPIFHINFILPLAAQAGQKQILGQMQRLTNAIIAIGSNGAGNPISNVTGESLVTPWNDESSQ